MYYCSKYTIVTSMYLLKMNVIGKSFRELADKVISFYLYINYNRKRNFKNFPNYPDFLGRQQHHESDFASRK